MEWKSQRHRLSLLLAISFQPSPLYYLGFLGKKYYIIKVYKYLYYKMCSIIIYLFIIKAWEDNFYWEKKPSKNIWDSSCCFRIHGPILFRKHEGFRESFGSSNTHDFTIWTVKIFISSINASLSCDPSSKSHF